MELTKFSVTNFRSITSARHVTLSGTTVLVGKNNEGKSNILKALSIAMKEISIHANGSRRVIRRSRNGEEYIYSWDRDFPISLKDSKGSQVSVFDLEFDLNDAEIKELSDSTGKSLNKKLSIKISIGASNKAEIKGTKKGKGARAINDKPHIITNFITNKLSFNYIPAVRTHNNAKKVIDDMISQELREVESDPKYEDALEAISEMQKPILESIKSRIEQQLSEFFPKGTIKSVEIPYDSQSRRVHYRGDFNVIIDDGNPTDIEEKGDGVKSLVALALLKNRSFKGSASIIAIEEPESHLHPEAIHQLKGIIESLEEENQIVLTTHNPLFINRDSIKSNIVVDSGQANPAKNIKEIRDVLGVRISDNLINARFVLVVEGETDSKILNAVLPKLNSTIAKAIKDNSLIIKPIGGASYLSYDLRNLKNLFCLYHVFFDFDEAANNAIKRAESNNLLTNKNLTQAKCLGMKTSEIEDCIDPELYKQEFLDREGVDIDCKKFKKGNKKWSDRMQDVYDAHGKNWDKEGVAAKAAKIIVADCVAKNPKIALYEHKKSPIEALVSALEKLVIDATK